ncbi:ACT domain-containing protein [Anaerolentibacter hominis]|uniref:ACT domain-containing protein n=1 Tax=Anaerolentibacter hominis TaxID=3079009 RepID=UPI0031B88A80
MNLTILDGEFSVCKLYDLSQIDYNDPYLFISKTEEELSLVCLSGSVPDNAAVCEPGWRAFRVEGELDFSLIGILSRLTGILAEHKISVFAISTYNTDYILVKKEQFREAKRALTDAGYTFDH